ncbi:MFS transporter [Sphingobium scionense]|jgi:MFS family permease|uniref:MFS family permease n=1 Tax=Sphingobium scionense TaxID=1404341 RepID=A0A7W6LN39_9SPHN|nr:MFS transporter [Sphingobium scionense]MBB4147408.1 MFS family permease [Sphingobium scionense]
MQASLRLLNKRRFLPLFITQLLGAFNDNLFKNAMVLFVVYQVYNDERSETWFSALATGIFIIPFFLLSALSGQLADQRDKAVIIRWVKAAEIIIMTVGATGLALIWSGIAVHILAIPLLLAALFAMGIHSTFFGPIKYAILPQHLHDDEVLGGTGLVEAGTYIAILAGTILAGIIPIEAAAVGVVVTACIGYFASRAVPPAPSLLAKQPIDFHVIRSSVALVRGTMHIPRLYLAIMSISFFWAVGSVLFIQFPPLVKNVLTADKSVASLFLAIFSIGIAIGSIAINRLLAGHVSAKYAPASVIGMGCCIIAFHVVCDLWTPAPGGQMLPLAGFLAHPLAIPLSLCLLGVATFGGMFVVPLYAFLTTTVEKCEAARTVAANNIVNSGAMVVGSLIAIGLTLAGLEVVYQLLLVAAMCLPCAWLAWRLHKACDGPACSGER